MSENNIKITGILEELSDEQTSKKTGKKYRTAKLAGGEFVIPGSSKCYSFIHGDESGKQVEVHYHEFNKANYIDFLKVLEVGSQKSTQNGVQKQTEHATAPLNRTETPQNGDKNRSFAMSYAKDLVTSGKAELSDLLPLADNILDWLDGKGVK